MPEAPETRCGLVAIVGRPNVGKSTLLNRVLGQKLSITSHRAQTTRHRILGIKTVDELQAVFVDTPGLHRGGKRAINRYMNRAAASTIRDVDLVIVVVEAGVWRDEDEMVFERVREAGVPTIIAVNKIDRLKDKQQLLPYINDLAQRLAGAEIIPLAARTGDNVAVLERKVFASLPHGMHFFAADQITDRSERFLAAELIREKLTRLLGQELPYALTVEIEQFTEEQGLARIQAVVWVERAGQKAIVIGKKGAMLKRVGEQARHDMERLFQRRVFLQIWVKVREGWSDDERAIQSLGYTDEGF